MSKTIVITGSTDGIGKLTALKLAKQQHNIYVHGRNKAKLKEVISELKEASGNSNINGFVADFSKIEDVKAMAKRINETISTLDVLINNTGVFKSKTAKSANNLDMRIAVNYIAPYVLTNAIISMIEASEAPRIINLSSAAQATVAISVLKGNEQIAESASYAQSKLALTMWSFKLAQEYPNITTIAVNPGSLLNTKMVKEAYGQHWSSAEKGQEILVELATEDFYKDKSGQYFDNDQGDTKGEFNTAHPDAYDARKVEELITQTEAILESL